MPSYGVQGDLQASIRAATGSSNTFNGDLHSLATAFAIPAGQVDGRIQKVGQMLNTGNMTAASALNYLLYNNTALPSAGFDLLFGPTLNSRITFTSTAGGTYYDSTGALRTATTNQPRFNYNQSPIYPRGLLITSAQSENASVTDLSTIGGMGSAMTMYAEAYCPTLGGAGTPGLVAFDDGTANNAIHLIVNDVGADQNAFQVVVGGVLQCSIVVGTATSGQLLKMAASWTTNSFRFACNGVSGTEDTVGSVPTVTRMLLGRDRGGSNYLNAELRSVVLFNYQMTNAQLAQMTA